VVTYDEWKAASGEDSVGRPQLAQILVEKGYVADTQEAFNNYLAKGAPAYFDRVRLGPEESVKLIREACGLPVLAHPYQTKLDEAGIEDLVKQLTGFGLAGIEAYYSSHTAGQTRFYLSLAERYGLVVTGGSDFHGSTKAHIKLGEGTGNLRIPYEIFEKLREAAGK